MYKNKYYFSNKKAKALYWLLPAVLFSVLMPHKLLKSHFHIE
jgi:hypothetical protein